MTAPDLLVMLHRQTDALPPVRLCLADRMRVPRRGRSGHHNSGHRAVLGN